MFYDVKSINSLVEHFRRFQGIGHKSAQRFVFQLLTQWHKSDALNFANDLLKAIDEVVLCPKCFNISSRHNHNSSCSICANANRNHSLICVVPTIKELFAIERTHEYKGSYHVLGGIISPIDGVTPDKLSIKELLNRIHNDSIQEVIFALTPSTEGEATILYIRKFITDTESSNTKFTKLAFGLSVGGDIEQTDELTLCKAIEGRIDI